MAEKDQAATAFITPYGPFCFNTMPLGLKNAGGTCQRMIQTCLADFVAEWTEAELPKEYGAYSNWIMHFDGSKMLARLGAGVVLTSPTGDIVQYVLHIMYTDSNNAAEYEAFYMDSGWQSAWAFNA